MSSPTVSSDSIRAQLRGYLGRRRASQDSASLRNRTAGSHKLRDLKKGAEEGSEEGRVGEARANFSNGIMAGMAASSWSTTHPFAEN